MTPDASTRRRILAAVGSVGVCYLGVDRARAALGLDPVATNQRAVHGTYAASTDEQLSEPLPYVALTWRETVNGHIREETGLAGDTEGETGGIGPIVDEAVVPGDTGSVTMRARLVEREGLAEGQETADAELYLRFRLTETAENGVNEPERAAGDTTPDDGELDDFTEITVWKDDGVGTGNGEQESIPIVGDTEIASGTLATVAEGTAFDGGYRIAVGGDTCLSVGDQVYVSFQWTVPEEVGNVIQGDSAVFEVRFDPRPCQGGGT